MSLEGGDNLEEVSPIVLAFLILTDCLTKAGKSFTYVAAAEDPIYCSWFSTRYLTMLATGAPDKLWLLYQPLSGLQQNV
jgi:hypothetical protein